MLLGLHVDGLAVVGKTNVAYSKAQELLGVKLTGSYRKGQSIKMTWLKDNYDTVELDENSTVEEKLRKTRMYILLLFSSLLFPDTNGNTIHIQFLPLLENIDKIGRYSWGAATLAHLYRNLCRCAKQMCVILLVVEYYFKLGGGPKCQD